MKDNNEKKSVLQVTDSFLFRIRYILITISIVVAVGLIGYFVVVGILAKNKDSQMAQIDELSQKYEEAIVLEDPASKTKELEAILTSLDALIKGQELGIYAQKTSLLKADVLADLDKKRESAENLEKAYKAQPSGYLAVYIIQMAATSYEENGNLQDAIRCLKILADGKDTKLPGLARVFFNIGRLYESQKNTNDALTYYEKCQSLFPDDENWTSLSQSRIIQLQSEAK